MIAIEHLEKKFEDSCPIKDLSLTINDGDVMCIIGPSGTGKSTLLYCLNLLKQPTAGKIFVDDIEITTKGFNPEIARRKISMVFQSFNLFEHFSKECADYISSDLFSNILANPGYLTDNIGAVPVLSSQKQSPYFVLDDVSNNEGAEELVSTVKGFEKELKPMLTKSKKNEPQFVFASDRTREFVRKYKENIEIKADSSLPGSQN